MKKQKNPRMGKTAVPGEWLYLTKTGIRVREIADAVATTCETEIWEDAGVLEIMLSEKSSMDVEHVRINPKDELTRSFVKEAGYEEVFLVTFVPEEYEYVEKIMKQIMAVCGGMFCGDTEDFLPVVRGE